MTTLPLKEAKIDEITARLREVGLRATQQRLTLACLLFGEGHRHFTAEGLYEEAKGTGLKVSLATIYNSLHQFKEAGLLREVVVSPTQRYFDTNIASHHHFFIGEENTLIDIPAEKITVSKMPAIPKDAQLEGVDIIIRLSRPPEG